MKSSIIVKSVNDEIHSFGSFTVCKSKDKNTPYPSIHIRFLSVIVRTLNTKRVALTSCVSDTDGYTAVFSRYSLLLSFFARKQVSK